jgi:hypothetical protein
VAFHRCTVNGHYSKPCKLLEFTCAVVVASLRVIFQTYIETLIERPAWPHALRWSTKVRPTDEKNLRMLDPMLVPARHAPHQTHSRRR